MDVSWRHGVGAGIIISALLAIGVIFADIQNSTATGKVTYLTQKETQALQLVATPRPIDLPFGGRNLLPTYRFVALYGNPEYHGLGSLGEQPLDESIQRVKALAEEYQALSDETVIPTFEIITTVAAGELTSDNDFSREIAIDKIKPWIDAAKEQGMYVMLDLQPGRSTFLSQAKLYEELLKQPHIGLALDPEWRLISQNARHLVSVGSVSAAEINETGVWLEELTKSNKLPQKMFMVHQFKLTMITERETMKTDYENLAFVLHMDGHGAPGSKTGTWNTIKEGIPETVFMGWKNFYDEDKPTPTPVMTMQQTPKPWFISYQ